MSQVPDGQALNIYLSPDQDAIEASIEENSLFSFRSIQRTAIEDREKDRTDTSHLTGH